jgi:hypothetical protein
LAAPASISTTAAAASLMPEALPAVTVPFSLTNTGFSLAMSSSVAPGRKCSSVSKATSPLRLLSITGVIWSLK